MSGTSLGPHTGSEVEVQYSEADPGVTKQAVQRIKTQSSRPAFADGQAIAGTLILNYRVRDPAKSSVALLIAGN